MEGSRDYYFIGAPMLVLELTNYNYRVFLRLEKL